MRYPHPKYKRSLKSLLAITNKSWYMSNVCIILTCYAIKTFCEQSGLAAMTLADSKAMDAARATSIGSYSNKKQECEHAPQRLVQT